MPVLLILFKDKCDPVSKILLSKGSELFQDGLIYERYGTFRHYRSFERRAYKLPSAHIRFLITGVITCRLFHFTYQI